jgi:phosphoglycolate phosphatase
MIRAVIFDLDGTLLDTLGDLAASGNAVLRKRGLPEHPTEAYRQFVGGGAANLVKDIFPADAAPEHPADLEAALMDYKAEYTARWRDTTVPYPGIADLLDALVEREVALGVLSNKAHPFTEQCVAEFLGAWPWSVVLGQRDGIPHKPDPTGAVEAAERLGLSPECCAFVGDSGIDMETGSRAGMAPIGVLWGFREAPELRAHGARGLIERPMDLLDWL